MNAVIDDFITRNTNFDQTAWFGYLPDMLYMIDNPSFQFNHNHPYRSPMVMAIYCRKGYATGRVNMVGYELQGNSFLIILPNQILESTHVSEDFEGAYIFMSEKFLDGLNIGNAFNVYNSVDKAPYTQLGDRAKEAIEAYIAMCRNAISVEENPNRVEMMRLITKAFFLGFGYFMHTTGEAQPKPTRNAELMHRFMLLVEANYRKHRDLEFYAERLNLSPKYLSKVIKSASGQKALHWIERYVILDAKSQLASTNDSVKQISYNLNFPSQSFFGKYFSRVTGMSPLDYRRSVQQSSTAE